MFDEPVEDATRGVYGISVVAELTGLGMQNIRQYEKRGLLQPGRTGGGTRRYSPDDVARLRRIGQLLAAGLNVAGIALVLDLEADNAGLRAELDDRDPERTDAAGGSWSDACRWFGVGIGRDPGRVR